MAQSHRTARFDFLVTWWTHHEFLSHFSGPFSIFLSLPPSIPSFVEGLSFVVTTLKDNERGHRHIWKASLGETWCEPTTRMQASLPVINPLWYVGHELRQTILKESGGIFGMLPYSHTHTHWHENYCC